MYVPSMIKSEKVNCIYEHHNQQTAIEAVVCGSCYGAEKNETHCCNTCQDVIEAYRDKRWNPNTDSFEQCTKEGFVVTDLSKTAFTEGCQIYGHLEVNRVSTIHIFFLATHTYVVC